MSEKRPKGPVAANLQYGGAYRQSLEEAQKYGICRFCEDQEKRPEVMLRRLDGWFIKQLPEAWRAKTYWPKEHAVEIPAEAAFLIIPERHIVWPNDIMPADWTAVGALFRWVLQDRQLKGGALGMRFDIPSHPGYSGRTVMHLHLHVVVPPSWPADLANPHNQLALPVPFWVG